MTNSQNTNSLFPSIGIYIISNLEYILKRSFETAQEYYYCLLRKNDSVNTIPGKMTDNGTIVFDQNDFHKEINICEMEKYQYKKLL
jgi:hypothetical protein